MPKCPAGGPGTTVKSNATFKWHGMRNKRSSILAEQRFQLMLKRQKAAEAKEAMENRWAEEWGGGDEDNSYNSSY
jgi:hypothetical protein